MEKGNECAHVVVLIDGSEGGRRRLDRLPLDRKGGRMKIYIAGSFEDQKALRPHAESLWSLGHEVTGSWLNEVARPVYLDKATYWRKLAIKDAAEVYEADMIILDNRRSSGGKNTEWGIGIGQHQKKLLWLVGEPSTVFHELCDKQFATWAECLAELKATFNKENE